MARNWLEYIQKKPAGSAGFFIVLKIIDLSLGQGTEIVPTVENDLEVLLQLFGK